MNIANHPLRNMSDLVPKISLRILIIVLENGSKLNPIKIDANNITAATCTMFKLVKI